jgi:hypothetical protein
LFVAIIVIVTATNYIVDCYQVFTGNLAESVRVGMQGYTTPSGWLRFARVKQNRKDISDFRPKNIFFGASTVWRGINPGSEALSQEWGGMI